MNRLSFFVFVLFFLVATSTNAQNKVVVIPMMGDDLVVPRGTNFITITPSDFTLEVQRMSTLEAVRG